MTLYEVLYFLVHCLVHCFGYWLPSALSACVGLLLCRPCRRCEKRRHGYAYHGAREVRVIHSTESTEAVVDVFGLMNVQASALEDRQYCSLRSPKADTEKKTRELGTRGEAAQRCAALHAPISPVLSSDADTYNSQRYPGGTQPVVPSPRAPNFSADDGDVGSAAATRREAAVPAASATTAAGHSPTYAHKSKAVKEEIARCHLEYDAPLYGPHIGTIMGAFRCSNSVAYVREEMSAWDGCYVAMDWYYVQGEAPTSYDHNHTSRQRQACAEAGTEMDANAPFYWTGDEAAAAAAAAAAPAPTAAATSSSQGTMMKALGVVFVVPGLTSHSQTNYVQHLVHTLHAASLHVCVLSTRGMGDTPPLTTPFLFNGAYTRDVRDCLQHYLTKEALALRFGRPLPLVGVGLSIGGIILSKYAGEEGIAGADPHLDALISCCSPMDFVMTVEHMNRQSTQRAVYQHDMCNDMRSYILRHEPLQHLPNVDNDWLFAQSNIHRLRRVLHFDEHIIAKSAGYRSAHHYHLDASAVTWLPYAPIPVLTISAADDPVIGRTVMPHRWREMVRSNPRLVYAEPPVGGHLGFLGGPWSELMGKANWMEVFVRDRVLAACAYWRAVQQHAKESVAVVVVPAHLQRHASSLDTPLPSPNRLFSPAAAEAVAASTPAATAAATHPALELMRVVPVRGTHTHRGAPVPAEQREVHKDAYDGKDDEVGAFAGPAHVADVPAAVLSTPPHAPTVDSHEPVQSDLPSACSTSLARDAKVRLSPHHVLPVSPPTSASPRPIQYLPPRDDRPTNRCYFTYYCTPAVPAERLHQPYFSRGRAASPGAGTAGAAAGVSGAETDALEEDGSTSVSTTGLEDGRSSMYASFPVASGGGVGGVSGGGGRRRGGNGLRVDDDTGDDPCHTAAGARGTAKDSRCMMVTGQYRYAPVVANCDYVTDPRTLMVDD